MKRVSFKQILWLSLTVHLQRSPEARPKTKHIISAKIYLISQIISFRKFTFRKFIQQMLLFLLGDLSFEVP